MSFDTVAELDLVVSDRALRNVQRQIESELGAVEIGATDGGTMSAQTGGSPGGLQNQTAELELATAQLNSLEALAAERNDLLSTIANTDLLDSAPSEIPTRGDGSTEDGDRSTREETERNEQNNISKQGRQALKLLQAQTEHLDDAVVYLEDIEDAVSEGGLGGGGGMMAEILGVGGDFAAEGAGVAADTVSGLATDVAGTALGQAAGSVIARQISGSTVSVEPNPLPVEGKDSDGNNVTVSPDIRFSPTIEPTFEPTFKPDLAPDINLPDLNFGIPDTLAVNRDPLPVQRDPLPVEDVGPIPVEEVGPVAVDISTRGTGSTSTGPDPRTGNELLEDALSRGAGGAVAGGVIGSISPDPFTTAGGAIAGGLTGIGSTLVGEAGRRLGGGNGDTGGSSTPANITAEITHSPTYNVDVDPRRLDSLADRIVSEIEDGIERDIDALENDLDELERELDSLEREITRR